MGGATEGTGCDTMVVTVGGQVGKGAAMMGDTWETHFKGL